jgi:putative tryptophan/tyrosine transport system substrate-binding protein
MQFDQLKRREFITLLGGAAVSWPLVARAQQAPRLPTIGFLGSGTPATLGSRVAAFVQRLRELGWIESRTIAIEYRWAESRSERATEIAAEFARLKVDVIVTSATLMVMAAKQATAVIPIVFANASDPVGSGLVASLAQPGGNVTGLSNQQHDIATKRLALLREAVPDLRRVAVMGNTDSPPVRLEMQEAQAAAGTLGLECATVEIRRAREIAPAFDALSQRAQALYLAGDQFTDANRLRISILALSARLPTIWPSQENVDVGLISTLGYWISRRRWG